MSHAQSDGLSGAKIIVALSESHIDVVASLPDITTSHGLLWPLARQDKMQLIRVCKEDEGISICAALAMCERRSVMLMQQTGLFDSLNAVRGIAVEYNLPVCMLVGVLGKQPEIPAREHKKYSVRIVEPVLKAMEIDHLYIENDRDIPLIQKAIGRAYELSRPLVILFGRRLMP
jgi:sulfopyruvate decarboxylase subunit alpha